MRLHEEALRAAARAIKHDRYLMHTVNDEALARIAIEAYQESKPDRSRSGRPPRAQRPTNVPPS